MKHGRHKRRQKGSNLESFVEIRSRPRTGHSQRAVLAPGQVNQPPELPSYVNPRPVGGNLFVCCGLWQSWGGRMIDFGVKRGHQNFVRPRQDITLVREKKKWPHTLRSQTPAGVFPAFSAVFSCFPGDPRNTCT